MALTIIVRSAGRPADKPGTSAETARSEPSLTFDTPRLVIGRGESCELRLPDPSVSSRHASIRQRGSEYILLDEGSTNGTFLASASQASSPLTQMKLAAQSPRVLRSGDLLRVGRVWLEVQLDNAVPSATAISAKELALELVTRALASSGEDARPRLRVVEGPDAGKELRLGEPGRHYLVGRAKDVDLSLDDEDASRRHFEVVQKGERTLVCDLGSKGGTQLGETQLEVQPVEWKPGALLRAGANVLSLEHAALEVLSELERGPDEPLRPGEVIPPPGDVPEPVADDPPPETPEPPVPTSTRSRELARRTKPDAEEPTWGFADGAVMLVALGVLLASGVGIWWLLHR